MDKYYQVEYSEDDKKVISELWKKLKGYLPEDFNVKGLNIKTIRGIKSIAWEYRDVIKRNLYDFSSLSCNTETKDIFFENLLEKLENNGEGLELVYKARELFKLDIKNVLEDIFDSRVSITSKRVLRKLKTDSEVNVGLIDNVGNYLENSFTNGEITLENSNFIIEILRNISQVNYEIRSSFLIKLKDMVFSKRINMDIYNYVFDTIRKVPFDNDNKSENIAESLKDMVVNGRITLKTYKYIINIFNKIPGNKGEVLFTILEKLEDKLSCIDELYLIPLLLEVELDKLRDFVNYVKNFEMIIISMKYDSATVINNTSIFDFNYRFDSFDLSEIDILEDKLFLQHRNAIISRISRKIMP